MPSGSSARDDQASLRDPNAEPNFDARPEWVNRQTASKIQNKATTDGKPAATRSGNRKSGSKPAKKGKNVSCGV